MSDYQGMMEEIAAAADSTLRSDEKLTRVVQHLQAMPGVIMAAFYLVDPEHPDRLVRGPHAGLDNPHEIIPWGKGLCGQVAERGVSIVLDDVSDELNYIAIHPDVISEIALPLFRNAQLTAVLDVMSTERAYFGSRERLFLEEVCLVLTDRI